MATTNRDVELGITVTTAGSENIKRLKDEVEALAKEGGAAAPEFTKLADELDRLGEQATALEAFDQIGRDIEALALAENNARKATSDLSVELAEATQKADQFRAAQAQARTEVQGAQSALTQARIELANYKNSTDAADASTEVYQAKVRELTQAVIDGRRSLAEKVVVLREAKDAAKGAEAEEAKLERSYNRSADEARKVTVALSQKEQAQRDQIGSLRQLGIETENLRAVDVSLINAMNAVQTETNELVAAQTRAAEAARRQADEEARLAIESKAAAQSYVNFWIDALNRREEAEKQAAAATKAAADAAKQSADAIKTALGTVGVKSAEELRREIQEVRNSLTLLGNSGTLTGRELDAAMNVGQRRINELERQIREATGQLTLMDKAAGLLKTTVGQFAAFISLTEIIQRLGAGFFNAAKQIEGLRLALGQIYGSAQTAGQQIDFLRRVANTAGISVGSISDAFVKFSASTRAANLPLEQTNALFASVTRAAGVLGLSGERVNQILDALSQIAAKGVVSMEELRQQLGDSLPGALSLAAKGLGLTEAQLIKLVESGGLLAQDLLPALTKSLQGLGGEVNTLNSAWERLKNATTATFQAIGDAGVITVLTGALKAAKAALDFLGLGLVTLIETIRLAFEGTGTFIGVLIGSGSVSEALQAAGQKTDEAAKRLISYREALFEGQQQAGAFAASMDVANRGTAEQEAALEKATAAIRAQTEASVSQGVATDAAAAQAKLAGQSWVQLGVALADVADKGENQILVSEKIAKAKDTEGKAAVELAKLTGDETAAREASINAANNNAAALQAVATVRERDLAQQIAYRDALIEEAQRLGDATGARTKAIQEITARINVLAAETQRARESANESRNNAIALNLEAAAIADNSTKLAEFTALRAQARAELEATIEFEKRGVLTKEDVKRATEQAAVAEALYRDALNDVANAANARITALRANATVVQAGLELERAQLEVMRQQAIALGNDYKVREISIKLKELDVKVARAKVEATNAEAKAALAAAQADLAALDAAGKLTEVKRAEIDARIANAKAKALEGEAGAERIKILEEEIRRIKLFGDDGKEAGDKIRSSMLGAGDAVKTVGERADSAANSINRMSQAWEQSLTVRNRAVQSQIQGPQYGADGFAINADGSRFTAGGQLNIPEGYYFDAEAANRDPAFTQGLIDGSKYIVKRSGGSSAAGSSAVRTTQSASRRSSDSDSSSSVRTIRLQLGSGPTTDINVASAADASRLEQFLSQLQSVQGRTL